MNAQQIIAERQRIRWVIAELEARRPKLPEFPRFALHDGTIVAEATECQGRPGLLFHAKAGGKVLRTEDIARYRAWINECFPPEPT